MNKRKLQIVMVILVLLVCAGFGVMYYQGKNTSGATVVLNTEKGILTEPETTQTSVPADTNEESESNIVYAQEDDVEQYAEEAQQSNNKMTMCDLVGVQAMNIYADTGILPSVMVADAMYESTWGMDEPVEINNFFNYEYEKDCGTDYKVYSYEEDSDIDGETAKWSVAYRKYQTVKDGLLDYAAYLVAEYPEIKDNMDYVEVCQIIQPEASNTLIKMIEQYDLDGRYDSNIVKAD